MVNFKYHVVSLCAVFIALAVGIILGAGPLQASIGNIFTDQVAALRTDIDKQKEIYKAIDTQKQLQDKFIEQFSPRLIEGKMGKTVSIVLLPQSNPEDQTKMEETIKKAGGKIGTVVKASEKFFTPDSYSYRKAFATQVSQYVPGGSENSDSSAVLGEALAIAITKNSPESSAIFEILTATNDSLISVVNKTNTNSDAVIVIGARAGETVSENSSENFSTADNPIEAQVQFLSGISKGSSAVLLGDATKKENLVSVVREAGVKISTVDGISSQVSYLSAVLAIADLISSNQPGAYGTGMGASSIVPPVTVSNTNLPASSNPANSVSPAPAPDAGAPAQSAAN